MKYSKITFIISFLLASCVTFSQTCDSIGVEHGWGGPSTTGWIPNTGVNNGSLPINWGPWTGPPQTPRFNITNGSGIDSCTSVPPIPVVCPGMGSHSIMMQGTTGCGGGCAERLSYYLDVTPADTNFTFGYAFIMEDPNHGITNQPFVSFCIYDQSLVPVPGAAFKHISGPNIPGTYSSLCNINAVSYYKPWTIQSISLAAYVGQTLWIEIINADCGLGGHFARSYWDFWCGSGVLATGEINNLSVEIFPSVSNSGIFSIKSNSKINDVSVYDLAGRKIYEKNDPSEIDLTNQPNGIYFLHLKTKIGIATKKIMIAK